MFAVHLRRVYNTCNVIIVREIRQSRSRVPPVANPGLDHRIKAFKDDGVPIAQEDAEEFLEQSESDLFKAHLAYSEYETETVFAKHKLKHDIVKQKYFKEHTPNFLTWSEKEQIRNLHALKPDEWTPEKIAESFPVTEAVVKKLIKYPWKPASDERIARHDETAMRNWKELKEGNIDIPPELRQRFLKFSNRDIPPLNKSSIKIDLTQKRKMGEFEQIVNKCAAQSETKQSNEKNNININFTSNVEASKEKVSKDYTKVTLEELATKIKQRLEKGKKIDMKDQFILDDFNKKPSESSYENTVTELTMENKAETKIVKYKDDKNDDKSIMDYPERIRIPKKAYKKGATYKVNDCYYDHDGKFLYRVLGMSN